MEKFSSEVQIRWSDLDPNRHLRHSVYYDWGAFSRIHFFNKQAVTMAVLQQMQIGPIIFREECIFRREIGLGDNVTIDLELVTARRDYSRWTIRHNIMKNGDRHCATLTVEGAWLNIVQRKLAIPPHEVVHAIANMPLAAEFVWSEES